jgi:ketosteroid isomerase-like protein
MSQENVDLTHQAYDAVNRRDLGALLRLMDADVEAVPALVRMEGDYHGRAGIRRWWENLLDVFPDFVIEVGEVRDLGDLALGTLRIRGHGADSEAPFDAPLWLAARWRHGRCVWWASYGTEAEALEAVGLAE